MNLICYVLAVAIPNVGSCIAITGATINPLIGYIFPIVFYLQIDKTPATSQPKLVSQLVLFLVIACSILGIYQLFHAGTSSQLPYYKQESWKNSYLIFPTINVT